MVSGATTVEVQTHDGPQAPVHDVDRRVYSLSSVGKSHDPMPHRRGSTGSDIQICRRPRRRLWRFALQTRPCSADRTRSPAPVSRKREYFKYPPETIDDFAPGDPNSGARRRTANSQKPAIGGPLWHCRGQSLRAPDWLADLGGFELAHS